MRISLTKALLLLIALLGGVSTSVLADITGRIEGKIVDAESGEPVIGVTVALLDTDLGGISDQDGNYFILQVPVGTHTLKFTSLGYTAVTVTELSVSADQNVIQDAEMSTAVEELGEGITVVAGKPLVDKGKSMSVTTISAEEIDRLPTRGYQPIVGLQAGVVTTFARVGNRTRGRREASTSAELNIRGGRPTSVLYLVDGFSQQDPLSGLSTTSINNNAIQEVSIITGGFPAEYGYVSAGVVNTITKSGTKEFSGTAEILSDEVLGDEGYGLNTYAFSIGGPLKFTEKGDFFLSTERREFADRTPSPVTDEVIPFALPGASSSDKRLPNNDSRGWTYQGKLRYNFTPATKLQLTGNGSIEKWKEYRHSMLFNSSHVARYIDENIGLNARLTHTVSPKTFFTLSAGYFRTERERGDNVFFDDLTQYGIDNFALTENLFYDPGATALQGGYLHRISSYWQAKADLTTVPAPGHTVKAGVDFQRHTLRRYNHLNPEGVAFNPLTEFKNIDDTLPQRALDSVQRISDSLNAWQDANRYGFTFDGEVGDDPNGRDNAKNPFNLAVYLQDRFNWNGMVITGGVRFDMFDYNTLAFADPTAPFAAGANTSALDPEDLVDSDVQSRLSPRLGLAFPIDDRTNMHFSFGKFFKRPDLDKLYVGFDYVDYKLDPNAAGYFFPIGNPNLEPERTTAYEVGISHQVGNSSALDVTAFYRDIQDLIQIISQSSNPRQFTIFQNTDFATVKGLELGYRTRRSRSITLDLKYTLSMASGTGSFANTQRNIAWTADNAPIQASPLKFDQRHQLTGIIDIRRDGSSGPEILQNLGLSTVVKFSSGAPYTPTIPYNEVTLAAVAATVDGPINSVRGPNTFTIDVKGDKTFSIGSGLKLNAYIWVQNLLDRKNPVFVYESSGQANTTGWLSSTDGLGFLSANQSVNFQGHGLEQLYNFRENDPTNFANPRLIQFGLKFLF